jgi:hypothetical protein
VEVMIGVQGGGGAGACPQTGFLSFLFADL